MIGQHRISQLASMVNNSFFAVKLVYLHKVISLDIFSLNNNVNMLQCISTSTEHFCRSVSSIAAKRNEKYSISVNLVGSHQKRKRYSHGRQPCHKLSKNPLLKAQAKSRNRSSEGCHHSIVAVFLRYIQSSWYL
jgi:hypothetical protein